LNLEDLKFQLLDYKGLQTLVAWATEEGWNPGPHDALVYWATDPEGFYGYYHEGELIAGGSLVSYNGEFGFMGFFIVKPEYRSKGLGRQLWYQRRDQLLSRLQPGATIGMDGVLAMQSFYQQGGFEIAYRDERHEKIGATYAVHTSISAIDQQNLTDILAYDQQCFGFARPQFLKPWLQQPEGKGFQYMENNQLKGFAFIRKASNGRKIGPLFADKAVVAEELYKACLNAAVGESVYLDIPVVNPAAVALTQKYETTYVFECARMYQGKAPVTDIHKIFGITTFELG